MRELQTERRPIDWVKRGTGLLAAIAVPFAVTALFQVTSNGEDVVIVCAVVGLAMLLRRGRVRAAGIGWLVGCALYLAFLAFLVSQFGSMS
jgi:uncharacterized membrane protein YeiH